MFEKEAEENLVEQLGFDKGFIEQELNKLKNPNNKFTVDALIREVKDAYQKGAEFGYNKAKEEMNEIGLALQSDMDRTIEQNIALKKQIEKMKSCSNCIHYSSTFGLCHYSMGDEDYDCRGRKWEIKE